MTRIRELRQEKGLSMAALSYETQVHPTTLSLAERRKLAPGKRVREVISLFLGVPEEEVFDADGLAV